MVVACRVVDGGEVVVVVAATTGGSVEVAPDRRIWSPESTEPQAAAARVIATTRAVRRRSAEVFIGDSMT